MDAEQERRRSLNERLRDINEPLAPLLGTYQIACECGDASCAELLEVPASVYEAVRKDKRAVVHPSHVYGAQIVASEAGWTIAQK